MTDATSGESTAVEWRAERVWSKHHERIADRWEWLIEDARGALAIIPEDDPAEAEATALLVASAPALLAENERMAKALWVAQSAVGILYEKAIGDEPRAVIQTVLDLIAAALPAEHFARSTAP